MTFWPWKKTFRANSGKPDFWQFISTLLGQLYAKIEKKLRTVFEQMASEWKKGKIWPFWPRKITFRAIQQNLSFDMWFISCQRSFIPKKEEKLLKRFWDRPLPPSPPPPPSILTDRQTDDGQLGIKKAPLPDGTAELKRYIKITPKAPGVLAKDLIPMLPLLGTADSGKVQVCHAWRHLAGGVKYPGQVAPTAGSLILVPPRPKEVFKVCEPKLVERILLP